MARATYKSLMRIGETPVPLKVRVNPRARRIIVKVHPSTGEVAVIAPSARAINPAIDFARAERNWIAGQLARVPEPVRFAPGVVVPLLGVEHIVLPAGSARGLAWAGHSGEAPAIFVAGGPEFFARRLQDFLKAEAKKALTRRVEKFCAMTGAEVARISVRDSASRWGSCSSRRTLSFSWRLIMAPAFVLDYVAAHEVAHLREMNHGPRFWALVRRMGVDAQAAQDWLRRHGRMLHRFIGPAAPAPELATLL